MVRGRVVERIAGHWPHEFLEYERFNSTYRRIGCHSNHYGDRYSIVFLTKSAEGQPEPLRCIFDELDALRWFAQRLRAFRKESRRDPMRARDWLIGLLDVPSSVRKIAMEDLVDNRYASGQEGVRAPPFTERQRAFSNPGRLVDETGVWRLPNAVGQASFAMKYRLGLEEPPVAFCRRDRLPHLGLYAARAQWQRTRQAILDRLASKSSDLAMSGAPERAVQMANRRERPNVANESVLPPGIVGAPCEDGLGPRAEGADAVAGPRSHPGALPSSAAPRRRSASRRI